MANQRIRIKLKGYEHGLVDASAEKIVTISTSAFMENLARFKLYHLIDMPFFFK